VEVIRRERKEERERWEKERDEERNRWKKKREEERKRWEKEREEERKRWEKERDDEREAWKREKGAERERWEREWERWRGEKKELESRIRGLEEERDRAERERRKRNVVIRGTDWGEESNEGAVEEFIKEKLKIEVGVEKTRKVKVGGKDKIMIAMLKSWEEKLKVMREKSKLGKGIYIDDDLTRRERELQQRLRGIARARREKGEWVKIGYKKLKIGYRWYRWNEREEKLEEEERRVVKA
jgi:flagellar biosynthesis GTPase FlhF